MVEKLEKILIALLIVVGVLFFIGEYFYLDWTIWWYDNVLHFLSGVVVGIFSTVLFLRLFRSENYSNGKVFWFSLFMILFVGVLWELFELYGGVTSLSDGMDYVRDTASDLVMDILGSVLGSIYSLKTIKRNG